MSTSLNKSEPSVLNGLINVGLILLVISFLIALPFMVRDAEERKIKAWNENGCQMYDNYKHADIPAKCSVYFVDKYQPQEARLQPTEAK